MAASNGGFKDFLDFGSLFGEKTGGLFRSTDGGASWTSIEILERDPEEPDAPVEFNAYDLVGDPTNPNRFYISLQDVGIFRSDDAGLTWTNVSRNDATLDQAIRFPIGANIEIPGINTNTEMSVASNGRIFVGTVEFGQVEYIGYSDDLGSSWEQMDLPFTPDGPNGESVGLQPRQKAGAQGSIHFSILADPNDPNTVYVGGDRQETDSGNPLGNSIGARDFSGRLFRGDTTQERFDPLALPIQIVSPQWEHLTHDDNVFFDLDGGTASSSAPHADSRGMTFDASGNLLEVDDGGIYRRTSPTDNTGDWFSMNGNLQVTEMHDVAYDSNSNIIIAGTQDVGTVMQLATGSKTWEHIDLQSDEFRLNADGGDIIVDDTSSPGFSYRYTSSQSLGFFRRLKYDANNNLVETREFPIDSGALGAFFVTPLEMNAIDQQRLLIVTAAGIYETLDRGEDGFPVVPNTFGDPVAGQSAYLYGGSRYGAEQSGCHLRWHR